MLDDEDEFQPNFIWHGDPSGRVNLSLISNFFFWGHHHVRGTPRPDFWEHLTLERLEEQKRRLPSLFKHQEEFLRACGVREGLSEGLLGLERARRGRPIKRETPLLKNSPRTTPKTVRDLLNRQRSGV